MVVATGYPFIEIFWTMLIFFTWCIWIWIVIVCLADVFRRSEISGWVKAAWTIFVIVLPFIGVLTYLVTNGSGMAERKAL
jgi:hypothetical protein